ncbi:phytoene desaturase family protein [Horticoccus sp. 23ND18S-11]|uniref:phytoene desaturase family protein n=1 Tax=Horticoccus sp. 23ND18S-11 TaxID=3391832 RepID=UPI0039C9B0FC
MPHYDAIFLGTGHNALVAQAYLARSGLRTLSLDRAPAPGGGLRTETNPRLDGFTHHPHSFFHRAITQMPWFRDLELTRHGVQYLQPELNVAIMLQDGRALEWWTDLDRTVASFATFSTKDAAALRRWATEFRPIVERILIPESQSPPLEPQRRRALLERSPLGRRLLEVSALSPLEFVTREFEHDAIRAGLLFFNGLREVDLRLPGFGHAIPALLASPSKAQMCVGGSGQLARGLERDVAEHGGEIRCGVNLRRIIVRGGRAVGVELTTGEELTAHRIVSGLNPQQTFLELLPTADATADLRRRAGDFTYNLLAPLFALNVALSEPPRWLAAARRPELERALMFIVGLERFGQFHDIVAAHERGEIPPTVAWGACPTLFDPTQAPAGRHVAFLWEKLPYALRGDAANWDAERDAHGRQLLARWTEHAPNLAGAVLDAYTRSALDTERSFPNMQRGDLLIGSFANNQVGWNRPFAGAGTYRTPIPGLYLCGGSTHPGGNVTGLCGYNAARVIVTDAGKPVWWNPPDIEAALAAV